VLSLRPVSRTTLTLNTPNVRCYICCLFPGPQSHIIRPTLQSDPEYLGSTMIYMRPVSRTTLTILTPNPYSDTHHLAHIQRLRNYTLHYSKLKLKKSSNTICASYDLVLGCCGSIPCCVCLVGSVVVVGVVGVVGALVTLVVFACDVGCFPWALVGPRFVVRTRDVIRYSVCKPRVSTPGFHPGFRPGFRTLVLAGFSLPPFRRSTVRSMDFDGLFGSLRFALQPSSYLQFDNNSTYSQFIRRLLTLISST
jgi:hypothetical protein